MYFDVGQAFALFENQIDKNTEHPYMLFFEPIVEIKTYEQTEVLSYLDQIQKYSDQGFYLVGYIAYEALEKTPLEKNPKEKQAAEPLIHFYAFKKRELFTIESFNNNVLPKLRSLNPSDNLYETSSSDSAKSNSTQSNSNAVNSPLVVYDFELNEDFNSYQAKIAQIKQYQRQGDTYQVNFTMKNRFKWQGSAFQFFLELKKYQRVSMAAFLHFDSEYDICSYSPELFIKREGNIITSKPMKGTAPRGKDAAADQAIVMQMKQDSKTMSENLMIVDLIRNDLGRIARPCSVKVPQLFEVESYATLHQMTSTVQAEVEPAITLKEIMKALFPCGSITGAPKVSTMKIIRELETEPRHIYTGALGYILPDKDFIFNVAIRTLLLRAKSDTKLGAKSHAGKQGELGIGSGIVYESDSAAEWDECLLKSKFIKMLNSPFQLIETFKYQGSSETFLRLELHLQRLSQSAKQLGFNCPLQNINSELKQIQQVFKEQYYSPNQDLKISQASKINQDYRMRILLFQNGAFQITHTPLELSQPNYRLALCSVPISQNSVLQRHKTTYRDFYEGFLQKAKAQGYDEILFFNKEGNCVEASRHNIIIKNRQGYFTPPVSDGALPGVYCQALQNNRVKVMDKNIELKLDLDFCLQEQSFNLEILKNANEIYLCNSVRGLIKSEVFIHWIDWADRDGDSNEN